MKIITQRIVEVVLLFFLGLWALLESYGLLVDRTGASLGILSRYLKDTFFEYNLISVMVLWLTITISSILITTTGIPKINDHPFFIMTYYIFPNG